MRVPLDPKLKEKPITKKKETPTFSPQESIVAITKEKQNKKRRITTSCSIANEYALRRRRIHSYIVNTEKGYITKLPVQTNTSQQCQNRSQFDTRRLLELDTEVERNMRKFPTKFFPLSVVESHPDALISFMEEILAQAWRSRSTCSPQEEGGAGRYPATERNSILRFLDTRRGMIWLFSMNK